MALRVVTDNRPAAHAAKVELRQHVLEHVKPARVFDAFCGEGRMYEAAWKDAAEYTGCDERFEASWPRLRRFVGDNRRVMRAIDLSRYNVFDFDAYGMPWEQLAILLARRRWERDELGAIVLTDGGDAKVRWGEPVLPWLAYFAGLGTGKVAPTTSTGEVAAELALRRYFTLAGIRPTHRWQAVSRGAERGSFTMRYSAVVFVGTGEPTYPAQ